MKKILLVALMMFVAVGFTMAQAKPHHPRKAAHRGHHKVHHHHPRHHAHPHPHK